MVVVRPLTDADIDAVAALYVRSWRVGYAGIVPDSHLAGLDPAVYAERRRSLGDADGVSSLVAVDGAEPVGFSTFGPYRVQGRPGGYDRSAGELYAVYVDPRAWGRGAGRALLTAVRAALRDQGYPQMRLWVLEANDRARRFYERMGLAPDGEREFWSPRGSGEQLPEVRYAVAL